MAPEASHTPELGLCEPDDAMESVRVPQPLQIVKRREKTSTTVDTGSRKPSTCTDDSMTSMPDPPGPSKAINVYKKRRYGCIQVTDSDEEEDAVAARRSSSQRDKRISSTSSYTSGLATMAGVETSTTSLALSNTSSLPPYSPTKSISSISRGKYLLKRAINGLDKDRSRRYRSDGRLPPVNEPFRTGASPQARSCIDLQLPLSSPKDSFNLERHLHESILESNLHRREACVLAPQILVTPEVKALDDGNGDLWVAIQIVGKLSRARDSLGHSSPGSGPEPMYEDATCYRSTYGHLYDLKIDLLPTANSTILEVVGNSETSRTLHLNSRILILAHISLCSSPPPQTSLPLRHRSDELMADLEFHLGSIRTEYLVVRLTYSHSTFPDVNNTSMTDGVAIVNNKVVTLATAVIKRHNSSSLWSPPPAPTSNPLFEIISSHWGPVRTADLVGRIAGHARPTPRRPLLESATLDTSVSPPLSPPEVHERPTPKKTPIKRLQVPVRRGSLKRGGGASRSTLSIFSSPPPPPPHPTTPSRSSPLDSPSSSPCQTPPPSDDVDGPSYISTTDTDNSLVKHDKRENQDDSDEDEEDEEDPARKIWTEMRKASRGTTATAAVAAALIRTSSNSSGSRSGAAVGSFRVSKSGSGLRPSPSLVRMSAGTRLSPKSVGRRDAAAAERRREVLLERAVRNKRSLGGETLRSLVPSLEGMSILERVGGDGHDEDGRDGTGRDRGERRDGVRGGGERKRSGTAPAGVGVMVGEGVNGSGSASPPVRRRVSSGSGRKRISIGWSGWAGWWA